MTRNIVTIEKNTVTTTNADCWKRTGSNGCAYCVMEPWPVSYPAVICYKLWSATATMVLLRSPTDDRTVRQAVYVALQCKDWTCHATTNVMVTDSAAELWAGSKWKQRAGRYSLRRRKLSVCKSLLIIWARCSPEPSGGITILNYGA